MILAHGKLRLPEGVEEIAPSLFEGVQLSEVKSIVIPKSVKAIDTLAFEGFSRLSEIVFLNTEIVLQEHWFVLCSFLRTIKMGAYPYLVFPFLGGRLYGINTESKKDNIYQLHLRPFDKLREDDGESSFWLCLDLKSELQAIGMSYDKDTAIGVAQTVYGGFNDLSEWLTVNLRLSFAINRYEYLSIVGYFYYGKIEVDFVSAVIEDIEIFNNNISLEQWGTHETKTVREVIILLTETEPLKQQGDKFALIVAEAYNERAIKSIPRRDL